MFQTVGLDLLSCKKYCRSFCLSRQNQVLSHSSLNSNLHAKLLLKNPTCFHSRFSRVKQVQRSIHVYFIDQSLLIGHFLKLCWVARVNFRVKSTIQIQQIAASVLSECLILIFQISLQISNLNRFPNSTHGATCSLSLAQLGQITVFKRLGA